MKTVKFNANICDGKIVIPEVYKDSLKRAEIVTIIIKTQNSSVPSKGAINQLMNHPLSVKTVAQTSREAAHERDQSYFS